MYPQVSYAKNGQEPITVNAYAADLMLANKLCNDKPALVDQCVIVAYMAEHENQPDPMNMTQVMKWARAEKVWAEQGPATDPTLTAP